jgi:hypothetical protein
MLASFNRFEIKMTKEQARSASHQGRCDDDVVALVKTPAIRRQLDMIGPEKIAAELAEYGAWDAEELADEEQNDCRIIWIAAGDIREEANQRELWQ